jgi:hypothetical protein
MNERERFLAVMECQPKDRVPNHELGIWPQTIERWDSEGAPPEGGRFDWWQGPGPFNLDRREFIPVNFDIVPAFQPELIERTERYETIRDERGRLRKALIEGTVGGGRMCMDTYLDFPVKNLADFRKMQKRFEAHLDARYPQDWMSNVERWKNRDHVLILARNCNPAGFYWRAREWVGTENLSYMWYDDPALCHEMMEFYADFTIEVARPILAKTDIDYFNLNEDFAGKGTPLIGPGTFTEFIYKPMKRLIDFLKSNGVRYVCLDSDGTTEPLIPIMMDAGIDVHWPLERASDMDPIRLRKKFGKDLRLWGAVDKREIAKGPKAIDAHLRELAPLIEEGGFIPTLDHTVPPDISWSDFCYYMESKKRLLEGKL